MKLVGFANIQNTPTTIQLQRCNRATSVRSIDAGVGPPAFFCLLSPFALRLPPGPLVGGQDPLAEASTTGGDLDELVVVDELDRLFQVEQPRWDQP